MTVPEMLSAYLLHLNVYGRPGTIETAEYRIKALEHQLSYYVAGSFEDAAVAYHRIDSYITNRRIAGIADSTINSELRLLRTALSWSGYSPQYVRLLKEGKRLPTVLDMDTTRRLVSRAPYPFKEMMLLAWRAGLRQGEILRLAKTDVSSGDVLVCAKPEVNWKPKSHHERRVPISPTTWDWLHPLLSTSGPWLFPGQDPTLPRSQVGYAIRGIFREAGLYRAEDKPGLHMLRRSWATELLATGTDIETVRQLGGWASLHIVQKYVTSNDERKREAIRRLE